MASPLRRFGVEPPADCPILALRDRRLLAWGSVWALAAFVGYGLVAAIIPNPIFGRQVPPTAASIWIWIVSAPLIGLVTATYTVPIVPAGATPLAIVRPTGPDRLAGATPGDGGDADRGGLLGTVGGFGAFLAIGCPVCNKVALVLLGASGALSVWAPIQPIVGAASLVLLAATLLWRLRIRARGGACSV